MKPDRQDRNLLALWAADCAEHMLRHFEELFPDDDRPRKAVEAARGRARGETAFQMMRSAALAAHAAARAVEDPAARVASRAAGQAAGTAHMAGHARHAAASAVKAVAAASAAQAAAEERDWQVRRLPEHLRAIADPDPGES